MKCSHLNDDVIEKLVKLGGSDENTHVERKCRCGAVKLARISRVLSADVGRVVGFGFGAWFVPNQAKN